MDRQRLRELAYQWSRTDTATISQGQMDRWLNEAGDSFARDVGGLTQDVTFTGDGARRSFDLPASTADVQTVYYLDAQEWPLREGDSTNGHSLDVLRDPDFEYGAAGNRPDYWAVEQRVPPKLWLDAVLDTGRQIKAVIRVSTVTFGPADTDVPVLPDEYHEALALHAAAWAARAQFDEGIAQERLRQYNRLTARYQQERGSKEPSGMTLADVPGEIYDVGRSTLGGISLQASMRTDDVDVYNNVKRILMGAPGVDITADDHARTLTIHVAGTNPTAGLTPSQLLTLQGAVQVDSITQSGRSITFASSGGGTANFDTPGITVQDEGVRPPGTDVNEVETLDFRGSGVTATQQGTVATITVTQPTGPPPAEHTDALYHVDTAPAITGFGEGDIIDVGGVLHVLASATGNGDLHGTAAQIDSNYLGVIVIPHATHQGSWSDPAIRAEFTWAPEAENIPLARLRLPRTAFMAAPPGTLYVQFRSADNTSDVQMTRDTSRDTGSGTGSTATGVYAWDSGATGVRIPDDTVGEAFLVVVSEASFGGAPLEFHEADRWQPLAGGGTARTADAIKELARDAVAAALIKGSPRGDVAYSSVDDDDEIIGTLRDGVVEADNLDVDTAAKQSEIRTAINAEGQLTAGAGIALSARQDGGRTIALDSSELRGRVGGQLDARTTFNQLPLDRSQDYRIEAVEYFRPHVFRLDWDGSSTPPNYQGSFEVREGITLEVEYTRRASGGQYAGRFSLVRTPRSTEDTLATLFEDGAINTMLLRISDSEEGVRAATELELPISDDAAITNSLAFVSNVQQTDPPLLASGTGSVWVEVNFRYTDGGEVTGWAHSTPDDISTGRPNGVAIDPSTPTDVWVSKFSTVDLYRGGSVVAGRRLSVPRCQGLAHNGTDLFVSTESYAGGEIRRYAGGRAYTAGASNLSWADQAAANPSNTTRGAIATDPDNPNDLYVFYADLNIRCFTYNGSAFTRAAAKDITPAQLGNPPGGILEGGSISGGILYALTGPGDGSQSSAGVVVALRLSDKTVLPNSGVSAATLNSGISARWTPIGLAVHGALMRVADNRPAGGGIFTFRGTATPATTYVEGYEFRTLAEDAIKAAAREDHVEDVTGTATELTVTKRNAAGAQSTATIPLPAGTDFDQPPGDTEHDFDILIRERVPGTPQTKAVTFAQGSTTGLYEAVAPFDGIAEIAYDNRSGGANENRYLVQPTAAVGGSVPKTLRVNANDYPLAPVGGATPVFRTPPVQSADGIAPGQLTRQVDLQYQDNTWANGSGETTVFRTLDREALHRAATGAPSVTSVPVAPTLGQQVNLLVPDTIDGYGVLDAGFSEAGHYAGWFNGTPDVGSLTGAPGNYVDGLFTYTAAAQANVRGTTRYIRNATETRTPTGVRINGRLFSLTLVAGGNHIYTLDNAPANLIQDGGQYAVQVEFGPPAAKLYPDITLQPGVIEWTGAFWRVAPGQWTMEQIQAWFYAWARAGNTDRIPSAKLPQEDLTQAEYDALVTAGTVQSDTTYYIVG